MQETKPPKFITNLTQNERQTFLDSFDTVFCDCDGVIWKTLREGIPGSGDAVHYLRKMGKKVTFVTNNSLSATEDIMKKFQTCNLNVEKQDIMHPAQTICDYLKSINFQGLIFCIASTPFKNLLRDAGFQLVNEKDRFIAETMQELRSAIYSNDPVKAVVIDVDFNMTATKLMRAHMHLMRDPECLFIGGAADTLIPFGGGDVIGPGPFINVIAVSANRRATILGKPGTDLCDVIKQRFHLDDPKRALFIGDSLVCDVKFGKMCGFQTLVVLTGATKSEDLSKEDLTEDETPDFVAHSLADLTELL